jgi:transposase
MPKQATPVVLRAQEEQELLQITRRHRSEQQVVLRARIVLAAAQGSSNAQIARELDVCVDTVRLWRDRWAGLQEIGLETLSLAERLQDAPRPGTTPKFTTEQRCRWRRSRVRLQRKRDARSASGRAERSRTK